MARFRSAIFPDRKESEKELKQGKQSGVTRRLLREWIEGLRNSRF